MMYHAYQVSPLNTILSTSISIFIGFRKPFEAPPPNAPLSIRTFTYSGEPHAAEHKAVLVAPVSGLGLRFPTAIHKFKLLAGVRWSLEVPRDAGFSAEEATEGSKFAEHGFIKISSEHFPEVRMNAKWCSDVLDELIKEANVCSICCQPAKYLHSFLGCIEKILGASH